MRRVLCGIAVASLGLVFVLSTQAQAQSDEASILYRQKLMASNGAHNGAIGDILKNKLAYQSLHIVNHAKAINLNSALIEEAFKKEITAGKTDAKPDIWKDWGKYVAAAKAMGDESAKLAEVAQAGNMEAIGAQMKKLGETCSNCHKSFRKPKEESYKR
jgi:cytochrome c556